MVTPATPAHSAPWRATWRAVWAFGRRELLYGLWAFMEVMLLTPFVLALMPWAGAWSPTLVAIWLLLLMLIPFNLARLLTTLEISLVRQRPLLAVGALLAMFTAVPLLLYEPASRAGLGWLAQFWERITVADHALWQQDAMILVLVTFCWWRGMRLVTREPDINRLGLRLRVGGLLLAPLVIMVAASELPGRIAPFLLAFLTAALTALALTRAEQIESEEHLPTTAMSPRWLAMVLGTSLLIVSGGGLLAVLIGRVSLADLGWLAIWWEPIRVGLTVMLLTLLFLLTPLLNLLEQGMLWLIALWRVWFERLLENSPLEDLTTIDLVQDPSLIVELLQDADGSTVNWRVVFVIVLLLVVVGSSWLMGRLYQRRRLGLSGEENYNIVGEGVLEQPEESLGRRMLDRLGWWRSRQRAASIRRIYRQMEQAAAAAGQPRTMAETPFEYQSSLRQVWPEKGEEIKVITLAYVRVRYGEIPETKAEFNDILQAWTRLQQTPPRVV